MTCNTSEKFRCILLWEMTDYFEFIILSRKLDAFIVNFIGNNILRIWRKIEAIESMMVNNYKFI